MKVTIIANVRTPATLAAARILHRLLFTHTVDLESRIANWHDDADTPASAPAGRRAIAATAATAATRMRLWPLNCDRSTRALDGFNFSRLPFTWMDGQVLEPTWRCTLLDI